MADDRKRPAEADAAVASKYQRLSQLEHILQRSDTYVGSKQPAATVGYVVDDPASGCVVEREYTHVPALYKVYDEVLVNAADNAVQGGTTVVEISVLQAEGRLVVKNNGDSVPVVLHPEHDMYVPELVFGHLLTSSNYDDTQQRTTGGRNGMGGKLACVFAREFRVHAADHHRGLQMTLTWQDNMARKVVKAPTAYKAKTTGFTEVSWRPDFAKLNCAGLDADAVALFVRRAYDLAGTAGVRVKLTLDGMAKPLVLEKRSFAAYADQYLGKAPRVHAKCGERWEVALALAPDAAFRQVSFVNAICTARGGKHVEHVANLISKELQARLVKQHKALAWLKPAHVRQYLWLFVNCRVVNPEFQSQTKEVLTTEVAEFGSKLELPDSFFAAALRTLGPSIVEALQTTTASRVEKELKKTDGAKKSRVSVPKLDDANHAGTRHGVHCTLIVTEGDSAKALAVSGLAVVGRDRYGVFPLRGKVLNVREKSHADVAKNAEISNLKRILGLQQGKDYSTEEARKSLRYGHLMLMTDQDHDGAHIKGLLINLLHFYWPALLKCGFLKEFVTPIVKAISRADTRAFFTLNEYAAWRRAAKADGSAARYNVRYYKGLGTSTAKEAKEYFGNIAQHVLTFTWTEECDGRVVLAFSKTMVDGRKEWLRCYDPAATVDHAQPTLTYAAFVDKELVHFSNADNVRSIPSLVDGLKPGQRKILCGCFKRGPGFQTKEVKVVELGGYVSEHMAYHHGDAALQRTIVGMAQSFVGANNIPLLSPEGQFGTRLLGGDDDASARYIFTKLPRLTRLLFHPDDDPLLAYQEDDGKPVEPKHYVPCVPLLLVNGARGIGTGWSTNVPCFNPRDVVQNLRAMLRGAAPARMVPWNRGFVGTVRPAPGEAAAAPNAYESFGVVLQEADAALRITELPLGTWTQVYKEKVLDPLLAAKAHGLADVREHHTDTRVDFALTFQSQECVAKLLAEGVHKTLKLVAKHSLNNMILFDAHGHIRRYEATEDILRDYFAVRLALYEARKAHVLACLARDHARATDKVRFLREVIAETLVLKHRTQDAVRRDMHARGYALFAEDGTPLHDADPAPDVLAKGYAYLLSMPLFSLSTEKIEATEAHLRKLTSDLEALRARSPEDLWHADLDAFEAEYATWLAAVEAEERNDANVAAPAKGKKKQAASAPAGTPVPLPEAA